MDEYNIDPVAATCKKYDCRGHGIQGLNDTCYGICAAFSGTFDTQNMDPQCSKACADLIEKRRYELFGVGHCDHQAPYRPVAWDEVPRHVPNLLRQGVKPVQALAQCLTACSKDWLSEECKDRCHLDFNAIVPIKNRVEGLKEQILSPISARVQSEAKKAIKPLMIVLVVILLLLIVLIGVMMYRK